MNKLHIFYDVYDIIVQQIIPHRDKTIYTMYSKVEVEMVFE